jgi:hypothetical protein
MRCPQKTVLTIIVHLSYHIWNAGLLAHPWRMRLCSQQKSLLVILSTCPDLNP